MAEDLESLIRAGKDNLYIATRLGVSLQTVRRRRKELKRRRQLGARMKTDYEPAQREATKMLKVERTT